MMPAPHRLSPPRRTPANDRRKGFADAIASHPDMKIIRSQSADSTRAKGKEVTQALLKGADQPISAAYAHNDDMALGALRAFEEAGKKPGTDIIIVSIDGVQGAFKAMAGGTLNATVAFNPLPGPMMFDAIDKLKKGEALPRFTKQADRLFDQSTARDEPPKRKY